MLCPAVLQPRRSGANALASPACSADLIAVGATYDENFPNCEDPTPSFNWGNCVDVGPSVDDVACFNWSAPDARLTPTATTVSSVTAPRPA